MPGYEDMSTKPQQRRLSRVWMLVLGLLLFALALTIAALIIQDHARLLNQEQRNGDVFIVSRLWTNFHGATNNSNGEIPATVERIARDATNGSQSKNYYEEQRAVVVNSESSQPILAERQDAYGPPQSSSDDYEPEPIYGGDDYVGPQSAEDHYVDGGDLSTSNEQAESAQGRAAQGHPYDSYYGQWQQHASHSSPAANNNRKLQPSSNRPPYPAYDDVYDYPMGFQPRPQKQAIPKQAVVATQPQSVATMQQPTESTIVTILKSLKQMWDLYQAISSAWGSVSERHQQSLEQQKKERLEKQRLRQEQQQQQQKLRINSKKPPRIDGDKLAQRNQTKKAKGTSTTTTSTGTTTNSSEESEEATTKSIKMEAPNGAKGDTDPDSSVRGLRHKREPEPASTDVGEGRYIKGDPLKGYYDFVITEGSYKFWAAFQVGTAILIIYSTFAAIYYSKVNPLTSDYDYQDYLGAGRSLSGGDDDFVDDSDVSSSATSSTSRIMDWLPRTAHSLKFILDAIDKIPLDHDQKPEKGWTTGNNDKPMSDEPTGSNR